MKLKSYFSAKSRQIKHISWFCAGFFFASRLTWVALGMLIFAILLDFLCYALAENKTGGA